MNRLSQVGSETLQAAFLRDEIPEAMVWLRNAGEAPVPFFCECGCCGERPEPEEG